MEINVSRFFSLNGNSAAALIRNLAPNESIVLDLVTDEGYDKPMRAISATATNLGYKIEQSSIKAIEHIHGKDQIVRMLRIRRIE
ncbi:hypothetical protein [Alishewanella phage vB_AspM_Slickus01]|nr:hypothetical protein [Alishewanella phage vB_AspM_Slickus01]